ncbi:hypothetical protein [Tenggerimyces flavus]|uniref:Uncharacterized protein n=1 Tax=Tenggerimyces flavus TaxID=1708749 RepID=A0ABV7YA51_9ACTN|nr:hypothetical protein [Tenggerimyces flavus]MBM7783609.1 transcriptional antiterminator [Tenggerimyces flavus]
MLSVTTRQIEATIDTLNAILEDGVDDRAISPDDETALERVRTIVSGIYTHRLGSEGPPMG